MQVQRTWEQRCCYCRCCRCDLRPPRVVLQSPGEAEEGAEPAGWRLRLTVQKMVARVAQAEVEVDVEVSEWPQMMPWRLARFQHR